MHSMRSLPSPRLPTPPLPRPLRQPRLRDQPAPGRAPGCAPAFARRPRGCVRRAPICEPCRARRRQRARIPAASGRPRAGRRHERAIDFDGGLPRPPVGLHLRISEGASWSKATRPSKSVSLLDFASVLRVDGVGERLGRRPLPPVEVGLGVLGDERRWSYDDNALVTVQSSWPSRFSDGAERHADCFSPRRLPFLLFLERGRPAGADARPRAKRRRRGEILAEAGSCGRRQFRFQCGGAECADKGGAPGANESKELGMNISATKVTFDEHSMWVDRAGSGCLDRFPRTISGVLPGLLSLPHRGVGRREGVARPEVQPRCGAETFMPPPRLASAGSKPRPGCVGQGSNAGAVDCRSRDSGPATSEPLRPCRRL